MRPYNCPTCAHYADQQCHRPGVVSIGKPPLHTGINREWPGLDTTRKAPYCYSWEGHIKVTIPLP